MIEYNEGDFDDHRYGPDDERDLVLIPEEPPPLLHHTPVCDEACQVCHAHHPVHPWLDPEPA